MKQIIYLIMCGIIPFSTIGQEVTQNIEGSLIKPTKDSTEVKLTVFLEGPYDKGKMITELNKKDIIPLSQPYNVEP